MRDPTITLGKTFVVIGCFIVLVGCILLVFSRFRIPFLGRLPGDILIQKKNFTFYFPLATSVLVSAGLSLVLFIVGRIRR